MDILNSIYTEKNNCQDCYKCVRRCPVKAIKIDEHMASVVQELCIYCGKCVQVCPAQAKKVRNDLSGAKYLMQSKDSVVLSLAPSFRTEFVDYTDQQLLNAFKQLGFKHVSETAIGAEIVSEVTLDWLNRQSNGVYFSSCCPVVVQLISKYYCEYFEDIAPFDSPMQAHAKYLKQKCGDNTKVVFAGPCIAKKEEVDESSNGVDIVLSFDELREWMRGEILEPEFLPEKNLQALSYYPETAGKGKLYPIDGGMIATMKESVTTTDTSFMSFSGIQNVKDVLENLPHNINNKLFLELLACEGGCINGPCIKNTESLAIRRLKSLNASKQIEKPENVEHDSCIAIDKDYSVIQPVMKCVYSDQDIKDALSIVGKLSEKDELNCGGCGYETCRHFAKAVLDGKAERHMCVSYMRKVAQNKASVLLQKMPYGVVLVDEHLKVIESNKLFAEFISDEAKRIYDIKPGMEGADIQKLTSLHKLFANTLENGIAEFEKDLRLEGKLFHLSIFSIQKFKIVCGIIYPLNEEFMSKDFLIGKLKDVIRDNLSMAQKAAFLLGENASRTETMLNTIIDSYNENHNGNE